MGEKAVAFRSQFTDWEYAGSIRRESTKKEVAA